MSLGKQSSYVLRHITKRITASTSASLQGNYHKEIIIKNTNEVIHNILNDGF